MSVCCPEGFQEKVTGSSSTVRVHPGFIWAEVCGGEMGELNPNPAGLVRLVLTDALSGLLALEGSFSSGYLWHRKSCWLPQPSQRIPHGESKSGASKMPFI